MKKYTDLSKVGAILLVVLCMTTIASCKRQKMQEPPYEFSNVDFIGKTLDSEEGFPAGVSYAKTTYLVNVVVSSITNDYVTVKYFTRSKEIKSFDVEIERVHDAFLPGDEAVLCLTFIDNVEDTEWKFDLNRKK